MIKRRYSPLPLLWLAAVACGSAAGQAPPVQAPLPVQGVTITALPGARQTFAGLGASIFPWTPAPLYNAQVTPAQTRLMARLLWSDARFRSARLWFHPADYAPAPGQRRIAFCVDGYARTGKLPAALAAGATDLLLAPNEIPPYMGDGHGYINDADLPNYAALLADFIQDFKAHTGILLTAAGILNEPNDRPVRFRDAQWPVMVKDLRRALDARGLRQVEVVAPESANCGADAYTAVDAIRADPSAWGALGGVATHSYNNAATEDMAGRADGKHYWVTEAGGMTDADEGAHDGVQAASVAARFLNDVNHRVTHWQFFIGAEQADPHGNTGRVLKYEVSPFRLTVLQKYYYLRQLSRAFDVGAVFRHSLSSLDGEMTYTYGRKPRLNAAVARNPDGTWAVGLCNFTSDFFTDPQAPLWEREQGGRPARTLTVTVRVPELSGITALRFAVRRSGSEAGDVAAGTGIMHGGVLRVSGVSPLELVTLRSVRSASGAGVRGRRPVTAATPPPR